MHKLEVGKPFRTPWTRRPEGAEYLCSAAGHELRIYLAVPTAAEIEAVRDGRAEFRLFVRDPVIFLLARLGMLSWFATPFNYHVVPAPHLPVLELLQTSESRILLQVFLIDAATGTLHVIRAISLSPGFSRALVREIASQANTPFSEQQYNAVIDEVFAAYPTKELMQLASERCVEGE